MMNTTTMEEQNDKKGSNIAKSLTKATDGIMTSVAKNHVIRNSRDVVNNVAKSQVVKGGRDVVTKGFNKSRDSVRAGSSFVFQVVRGAIVVPFRSSTMVCADHKLIAAAAEESIWVGPETILKNRCLNAREECRTHFEHSYHLKLELKDPMNCIRKGQRILVTNIGHGGEVYKSVTQIKLSNESFDLLNYESAMVAKCIEDKPNVTTLVCGSSPLFVSDKAKDTIGGTSLYPWLQVSIDETDLSVDLWSGHSYTPLWYAERVRQKGGTIEFISAENDEPIGEFISENGQSGEWEVKSNAGIDPAMSICLACTLIRFHDRRRPTRLSNENLRASSKIFQVVDGEVLVPFMRSMKDIEGDSEDDSDDDNLDKGVWVGPEEIVENRFLSKYHDDKKNAQTNGLKFKLGIDNNQVGKSFLLDGNETKIIQVSNGNPYMDGNIIIAWHQSSFMLRDFWGRQVAKCIEDLANLTSIICGTCPLFKSDEPIERTGDPEFFPWLQVRIDGDDLLIDMWSGHGYTPLWYAETFVKHGEVAPIDVLSVESEQSVGQVTYNTDFEIFCKPSIDPDLFLCLTGVVCRFVEALQHKSDGPSVRMPEAMYFL